nr:uncharacterized protein C31H12.03c-like [Quercus suber]POF15500.1 uncharacterized protein c31h12.03c [Quercus suber]
MSEYAKKKNDELATLCKDRGLPHTGKKADLVKRLEEHDAQGTAPIVSKPAVEDEIDWDEDPAADSVTVAATQPTETIATSDVANSSTVPSETVGSALNNATSDADTEPAADVTEAVDEPKAEEKDFSSGAAMRTLEEEIEKRKKRARKFGMPEDSEEIKALERAKRFGTADLPGLLNKALPDRSEVKKRNADGLGPADDAGIRKKGRGRGGPGRGRDRRDGGGSSRESGSMKTNAPGSWMSENDRAAAERRKARFA